MFSSEITSTGSNTAKVSLRCLDMLGKPLKTSRKHSEKIFSNLKFGHYRPLRVQIYFSLSSEALQANFPRCLNPVKFSLPKLLLRVLTPPKCLSDVLTCWESLWKHVERILRKYFQIWNLVITDLWQLKIASFWALKFWKRIFQVVWVEWNFFYEF